MIYKSDRKKWLPAILERVDESQLPAYFGGTLTDEDGNPKCVTKVSSMRILLSLDFCLYILPFCFR